MSRPRRFTICTNPRRSDTGEPCPNLTEGGGRCEECRRESRRAVDQRRPSARRRGYDSRWERTRREYLASHPICECTPSCTEQAVDVDHIDGLGPTGPRGHDWNNLRAMAHGHHSKRTARDQPAGWNRR